MNEPANRRQLLRLRGDPGHAMLGLMVRGAAAQCCGDCNGDGAVTVDDILTAVNHALTSCSDDGICSMASCPAQLATCRDELATCRAQPGGQRFPASGQTTAYGPGSDGAVRAGAALAYTGNGDGTITDNNTGLMWEKKDDSGGIHDQDNYYAWGMTDPPYTMNGTMVTEFLATLNRAPCFAGHCDWRIPNIKELQSIANYQNAGPAVDAAFSTSCAAGCTVDGASGTTMCSCTQSGGYWSSTTCQDSPDYAWGVGFGGSSVATTRATATCAPCGVARDWSFPNPDTRPFKSGHSAPKTDSTAN
ncbi:MAG TPA: DUF1566 domain-containing protein [Candidatus Binatia bacterium]